MERFGWRGWLAARYPLPARKTMGRVFQRRVQITKGSVNLDWGPDARPKIVVDAKGDIALAFSTFRDEAFNGEVLYTRSGDGGKTFAEVRPITANKESQRFEALALDSDGSVFAAWLDKRDRVEAKKTR